MPEHISNEGCAVIAIMVMGVIGGIILLIGLVKYGWI